MSKIDISILSFPSTGKHWMLHILNKAFSLRVNAVNEDVMGSEKAKIFHTHLCWKRNVQPLEDSPATIFILRNYKENITKFTSKQELEEFKQYIDTNKGGLNDKTPQQNYMRLLSVFHKIKKPKILIYYEDLMENPQKEIERIAEWLKDNFGYDYNQDVIDKFIENIEAEKEIGRQFHKKNVKNPKDLRSMGKSVFHSEKLSYELKREIDKYIKKTHPELFELYLKRYAELKPKYDALIKSGTKDYSKLKQVINSIKHLNPQPSKIYLINPDGFKPTETDYDDKIIVVKDEEVFPGCDRDNIGVRKNWCFATFMALFQNVTEQDYYLDIQSDNFFMKPLELFKEDGTPIFFMSPQHSHYHEPYFTFSKKMFNIGRVGDDSFIIDFMMYNKNISKEMLEPYGDFKSFFVKACENINKKSYPTEQDCYANWCLKHHEGKYEVKKGIATKLMGKNYPNNYSEEEVENIINSGKHNSNTAISLHTWGDSDSNSSNGYS